MSSSVTDISDASNEEFPIKNVLLICVALVGALVGLLILRFLLNVFIDAMILGERRITRRSCSCLVVFCCFASPPNLPTSPGTRANANSSTLSSTDRPRSAPCCADEIEVELSTASLLSEILPGRAMTQGDWQMIQSRQSTQGETLRQSSNEIIEVQSAFPNRKSADSVMVVECSICLQDMRVGMLVHETELCGHLFHALCIREWLVGTQHSKRSSCFNNHCPNCRTRLVDPALRNQLMGPETP